MYAFLRLFRTTALESLKIEESFHIVARIGKLGNGGTRGRNLGSVLTQSSSTTVSLKRNFLCLYESRLYHTSFFERKESPLTCCSKGQLFRKLCTRTPSRVIFKRIPCKCHGLSGTAGVDAILTDFQAPMQHHDRHLANRKDRRLKKNAFENVSESDSEEEIDLSGFEDTEHHDEDKDLPKNFRTLQVNVKSPRVDSLIAAGLNISRSKTEDYFLESKLRVNGEKCLKKSKKIGPGDSLDLVMETGDGYLKVKRVRILAVSEERTRSDRCKVLLKAWRNSVTLDLPKNDFHVKRED